MEYVVIPILVTDHPKTQEQYEIDDQNGDRPYENVYGYLSGELFYYGVQNYQEENGIKLPYEKLRELFDSTVYLYICGYDVFYNEVCNNINSGKMKDGDASDTIIEQLARTS